MSQLQEGGEGAEWCGAFSRGGAREGGGYLGGALTGSVALPVEVLAASFAFAGRPVVGGVDRALQVDPRPRGDDL